MLAASAGTGREVSLEAADAAAAAAAQAPESATHTQTLAAPVLSSSNASTIAKHADDRAPPRLNYTRVISDTPSQAKPFPARACFPCDWAELCKHAEGQSLARSGGQSRLNRITGVYWQKILGETYCGVSSDCAKRHPAATGWCGAQQAAQRQAKTGRCCEPALVSFSPDRTGTTATTTYLHAHAQMTMGLTKEHNWLPAVMRFPIDSSAGAPCSCATRRPPNEQNACWQECLVQEWAQHFPAESDEVKGVDMSVYMSPGAFLTITSNIGRFKSMFPNARVFVLLRNPVERLYAVFRDLCYYREGWVRTKAPHVNQAKAFDIWAKVATGLAPNYPPEISSQVKRTAFSGSLLRNLNDYSYLKKLVGSFRDQMLLVPSYLLRGESTREGVLRDIFAFVGVDPNTMDWAQTKQLHRSGGAKGWAKDEMLHSTKALLWEHANLGKALRDLESTLCSATEGAERSKVPDPQECVAWVRRAWGCDDTLECWPPQ